MQNNNTKTYNTENGNKYVRYYPAEGENSAFKKHNGAIRRAIESRASIIAAAKVGATYDFQDPEFQSWINKPDKTMPIDRKIQLTFIKECERLAQLPEKDLLILRSHEDDILLTAQNRQERDNFQHNAILDKLDFER